MCRHYMLVVRKLSSGLNRVQVVLKQTTGFQKVQISEYHRRLLLGKLGQRKTGKKWRKCKKRDPSPLVNLYAKKQMKKKEWRVAGCSWEQSVLHFHNERCWSFPGKDFFTSVKMAGAARQSNPNLTFKHLKDNICAAMRSPWWKTCFDHMVLPAGI